MKRSTHVLVLFGVALLGLSLVLGGCQAAAEKATESAIEGATGVDVDADENKVTIEGDNGESVEIQNGAGLPEGFPQDAPVYDADVDTSGKVEVNGATTWTLTQTTSDEFDDIVSFFVDDLADQGWTQTSNTQSEIDGEMWALIAATKGSSQYTVSTQQGEGEGTILSITVNQAQ